MGLKKLLDEGKLKNDGWFNRGEIDKAAEEMTKTDLAELKQEILSDKGKLKAWIEGELQSTTERYLKHAEDKKWIKSITGVLKQKFPDIYKELEKTIGAVNADGSIKNYNGKKGVAVLQAGLNALAKIGKYSSATGLDGNSLKIDGIFGKDTAWAVINYQKLSSVYHNMTLEGNDPRNKMGGRLDLIANGRTVHAIYDELQGDSGDGGNAPSQPKQGEKPGTPGKGKDLPETPGGGKTNPNQPGGKKEGPNNPGGDNTPPANPGDGEGNDDSEQPDRKCPNPENPNTCPDTRNPDPNINTREGKMFIPPQKDRVGPVDIVRETPGQKHSVTMSSAELNKYVMDQLKNGNSFDQATKDKIENFMKKSQTYMLLWGLMSADAKIFSDPKNTNFMKDFGRYMNKSPLYTEEGKKMFEQYSKEYQGYLLHLSNAILTGNQQQANSLMDNYKIFDTFFSKDMKIAVSNLGLKNIGGEYFYNKMVSRYKPRFDAGETFAVYEFMSEVMKDNMYSDGIVYNNIDITGTNEDELNKYLKDEPVNTGTIDTFFKGKSISVFGKQIPMPQNRNYGELIKEYRKESLEMEGNIIEPRYVLQRLLEKFLKDHETQIKERFSPDSSQGKFINLFFENRTILNELGKNRSGIAFKTSMSILAAEAVCLGLGLATGGVVTKLMTSTSSVSQGIGKAIQYGTRQLAPALSMVPMSHIMAGDFNSDNIMKDLGNKDTWFMIAMFGSINTAMGKLTTLVSEKTALGRYGNTIKLSGETIGKGNRFVMAGFDMASYLAESGITLGINHMMFDGEFTAEEIINALLFVGIMRSKRTLARKQIATDPNLPAIKPNTLPDESFKVSKEPSGKITVITEPKMLPPGEKAAAAEQRKARRAKMRKEKPWEQNQGSPNDPKNRYTRVDTKTSAEERTARRTQMRKEKPWEQNQGSPDDPKTRYTRVDQEGKQNQTRKKSNEKPQDKTNQEKAQKAPNEGTRDSKILTNQEIKDITRSFDEHAGVSENTRFKNCFKLLRSVLGPGSEAKLSNIKTLEDFKLAHREAMRAKHSDFYGGNDDMTVALNRSREFFKQRSVNIKYYLENYKLNFDTRNWERR